MKKCTICGKTIINGENGCAMYETCVDCKPIVYRCKPRRAEPSGDAEAAVLARQERDYND